MNIKTIYNISLLLIVLILFTGCAFTPKTIPGSTQPTASCDLSTSEWTIDVTPIDITGAHCHSEACAMVIVAVPLVTAVISLPIVLIGNSIHIIEEQLSCN
ncbi:MAG: hypothetical protein ACC653_11745 [Gammaproteobacteria bacterium]